MKRFLLPFLILGAPLYAAALTTEEINAQIQALNAQIAAIEAQIQAQTGGTVSSGANVNLSGASIACSISRYPLKKGDSGEDVRKLQMFLATQGVFTVEATGYFGSITEKALIQFQLNAGIISNPADGGVFGPKTFQYLLSHFCLSASTFPVVPTPPPTSPPPLPPPQCTPPPQPSLSCSGQWLKIHDAGGCHTGWTCSQGATSTTANVSVNGSPTISGLTGLIQLRPGENGTWTITATDPENDPLVYSAVFGDEGANMSALLGLAEQGASFSSSRSFTHAYKEAGSYTIVAFARDTAGNTGKATLSLRVVAPVIATATTTDSVGISCILNGTVTAHGVTIANPMCSIVRECDLPRLTCINGSWVAAGEVGSINSCILNGQVYPINTADPMCNFIPESGLTDLEWRRVCTNFLANQPGGERRCTANGWVGGSITTPGIRVACTTARGDLVAENTRIRSQLCSFDAPVFGCGSIYICRHDGWWLADSAGNLLQKTQAPPGTTWEVEGGVSSGSSCVTPWGNRTVDSGGTISSQPYFTGGSFTGTVVVPLMRCSHGAWLTCDWQGFNCR